MPRYPRAPSEAFQRLLQPGGFLRPLLEPLHVQGHKLDVHLRLGDELHLYCGLTCILIAARRPNGSVHVRVDSDTYRVQPCAAPLLRTWKPDDATFPAVLEQYFGNIKVNARHHKSEGAVQIAWASVRDPWLPLDRESVLEYGKEPRTRAPQLHAAVERVRAHAKSNRWAAPELSGNELDQLGIDLDGHLVLAELKHASASGVYYAPLQLLHYVHEWSTHLDHVLTDLARLREARIAIGLSPATTPALSGKLRPIVAFGADTRTPKVRSRFDAVLSIANDCLPPGILPIETWCIDQGTPRRIAAPA